MRCFALQYAGRATILQSAVVSLDRLKQDKNVGPEARRPVSNVSAQRFRFPQFQDRSMNRIQIGAALGLVVMLGGWLGASQLLTPVAARTQPQDSAATIAML